MRRQCSGAHVSRSISPNRKLGQNREREGFGHMDGFCIWNFQLFVRYDTQRWRLFVLERAGIVCALHSRLRYTSFEFMNEKEMDDE